MSKFDTLTDEESPEAHFADGGYAAQDDFDYDQFVQDEYGVRRDRPRRLWYWVAWLMIVVMLLAALVVAGS